MNTQVQPMVSNPFGHAMSETTDNALATAESQRQEAEIQSSMVIAKRFPRNQIEAMDKIIQSCTRPALAESALYAYPRGSEMVTGPSIRLAEAMAQCWGNIQFGIRELSQSSGESTVEAFAWDIETNTRQCKVFQVRHIRHTRKGAYKLEDPRDIYEMVANQGSRRLRACILGIIPGDVVEAAVKQCEVTQANSGGAPEEQIKNLLDAFKKEIDVSREQIEQFLGHRVESTVGAEVVRLRKVFMSIKDGMASVGDFFEVKSKPKSIADMKKNPEREPGEDG